MIVKKKGFTLIELLVVISIIAILAGLLMPAISKSMQQAKRNQVLSEMQHLATVITQVYSEVGYYVRLEDLPQSGPNDTPPPTTTHPVYVWFTPDAGIGDYSIDGQSDSEVATNLDPGSGVLKIAEAAGRWAGPYITYKKYSTTSRPLDPWNRQYRMFWSTTPSMLPAGATGTMVIISAGSNGRFEGGITASADPQTETANHNNFSAFDPNDANKPKGDDIYFAFNAGFQ